MADDIRTIAKALGREQEGEALIARLTATMDEARAAQQTYPARPRILVLFDGLSDQLSSMGPKSGGDALVQLLGGDNAVDVAGMKLLSPEALVTLPADAILIARLIMAPAELPIGILTAAIGAPFLATLVWQRLGKTE